MSFGLALMQNKFGKGFNISNILEQLAERSEAAMPDFRKAVALKLKQLEQKRCIRTKQEVKKIRKAQKRSQYLIIPKGTGGIKGTLSILVKAI